MNHFSPHQPHVGSADSDVVVVGGRVAGAATTMLLARRRLRVLVIDRGAIGSDTLSAHALMRAGVMPLHRWRLLDALVEAGTPPIRNSTFWCADESVPDTVKPAFSVGLEPVS